MRRVKKINVFKSFMLAHINLYIFLSALFIIGLIIGIIHSAYLGDTAKSESYEYIYAFLDALKTKKVDIDILFREFIFSNLKPAFLLWALGLCIVGIPIVCGYILFEGYSLGFVIAVIINSLGGGKGSLLIGTAILPQEIILIPAWITLAVNSILFANAVWGRRKRTVNIKFDVYRFLFLFVLILIILVGISFIQTYIQMPLVKVTIGSK